MFFPFLNASKISYNPNLKAYTCLYCWAYMFFSSYTGIFIDSIDSWNYDIFFQPYSMYIHNMFIQVYENVHFTLRAGYLDRQNNEIRLLKKVLIPLVSLIKKFKCCTVENLLSILNERILVCWEIGDWLTQRTKRL